MSTAVATTNLISPKVRTWAGRVLTALPILMLLMSAFMKLSRSPELVEKLVNGAGFPESTIVPIGLLELAVVALYAVPRTRVLGAILVTGYLGGAIVAHVRVGEPFMVPLVIGILAWAGLYLTESRLSSLVPFRAPR